MSVMLLANTMKSFIYKENVDTANYRNLAMIVQKMLFNTAESNNKYIANYWYEVSAFFTNTVHMFHFLLSVSL